MTGNTFRQLLDFSVRYYDGLLEAMTRGNEHELNRIIANTLSLVVQSQDFLLREKGREDVRALPEGRDDMSVCPEDDDPDWVTSNPVLPDLGWLNKTRCKDSQGVSKGEDKG